MVIELFFMSTCIICYHILHIPLRSIRKRKSQIPFETVFIFSSFFSPSFYLSVPPLFVVHVHNDVTLYHSTVFFVFFFFFFCTVLEMKHD